MKKIKFIEEMIEAIEAGRKTKTRRVIKVRTDISTEAWKQSLIDDYAKYAEGEIVCVDGREDIALKIKSVVVERLHECYRFKDYEEEGLIQEDKCGVSKLEEELHDEWMQIWDRVSEEYYKWNDNPYVFVYEFERVEK